MSINKSDLDQLVNDSWAKHADEPENVAEVIKKIKLTDVPNEVLDSFLKLYFHVVGAHLNRFGEIEECLRAYANSLDEKTDEYEIVLGWLIVNSLCKEVEKKSDDLFQQINENIRNEVYAKSCLLAACESSHLNLLDHSTTLFQKGKDFLSRAQDISVQSSKHIAIACNNFACKIDEEKELDSKQMETMIDSSLVAKDHWKIAGKWMQVERAEYRVACSYLRAKEYEKSLKHAKSCEALCLENGEDPFELFFAHEIQVKIHRSICEEKKKNVNEDLRKWCKIP